MTSLFRGVSLAVVALVCVASLGGAQDFRGRINGTIIDHTGAVLPGVTVTASSGALIQPQVQVSGTDAGYRFLALPPGVYDVTFELAGFQTLKRENIRVVINQTLTVDVRLQVASVQESVTVTGESPVVDVTGINDVEYNAAYTSDSWRFNDRLTLNLGGRLEIYRDGWPEQEFRPNGHPTLADWSDSSYRNFVAPITVQAKDVAHTTTFAPRAGFAYDLTGDNRTVLKAFWGKFYFNSADTLADQENPVGRARLRYQFRDSNGNRLLDGPQEVGRLLTTVGGGGFVRVDPDIQRPYGSELSTNIEREIVEGLSGRVSYVYKNIRNDWAISERFSGDGSQTVRVEPITANRYPNVAILDFRIDKSLSMGRAGRLTGMVDVFNVANAGTVIALRRTTVNYREMTQILDPTDRPVRLAGRILRRPLSRWDRRSMARCSSCIEAAEFAIATVPPSKRRQCRCARVWW